MTENKIYIGLNDSESLEQKFDTDKYISILKNVCRSYSVPFSFTVSEGGYIHDNGEYTQETSLIISMIDVDMSVIHEIANDLCVFFNQESVLITENPINAYFLRAQM